MHPPTFGLRTCFFTITDMMIERAPIMLKEEEKTDIIVKPIVVNNIVSHINQLPRPFLPVLRKHPSN